ncbi:MAG: DUF3089 domain-containing protein [Flavobacteriaceae bacterium]
MKKNFLFLIAFMLLNSCKTAYKTAAFEDTPVPTSPNYADQRYWAVLPSEYPEELIEITGKAQPKNTDVFFVYPTLLTDKKDPVWNADVHRNEIREKVITTAVKYQASAFVKAGNLYVPFYRQSHYKIYVPPHDQKEELSRNIAYTDIRAAFQYYLAHYNQGRPIIIASHSQGSIMCGMLLKEFFDDKPLQKQLVAAYIPGVKIQDKVFKSLRKMENRYATGGYVSWNTFKKNNYPPTYEQWYKGATTTNPITWDTSTNTDFSSHLGVLNSDGKIYPSALKIELVDGLVWSSVPKIPKRFFLSFVKNYHFADINLFWKDIEQNAIERAQAWQEKNPSNAR